MENVLVTARSFGTVSDQPADILEEAGLRIVMPPGRSLSSFEAMVPWVADVSAMIISRERVSDDVFARAPKLRAVVKHGVGVDNIDIPAAHKRGIVVANTPGANRRSVAELTVGLMLALSRQVRTADGEVRAGGWPTLVGQELSEKCVGIIGLGNIGSSTARLLSGFGCRILAYDPYIPDSQAEAVHAERVELAALLTEADYVCLHVPLTAETHHMIGEVELAAMKEGSFLLQLARGGVVDETALAKALFDGHLGGAAVDVFEQEPPLVDHILFDAPNLIFTPHMGAHSREAMNNMSVMAAQNVVDILRRGKCPHQILPG